jgi:hypothetical protein
MSIWKNRCNTCGRDQDECECYDDDIEEDGEDTEAIAVLPKGN